MTWGNRLFVAFVVFAALIGTMVYKSMNQNVELVSKDYYMEELRYQDKIDATNQANKLSTVQLSQSKMYILIQLPKELNGMPVTGEAWFYCPSNSLNDRKLPVQVNEAGLMQIDKSGLEKDYYQLKLKWQNGTEQYYNEQRIQVK